MEPIFYLVLPSVFCGVAVQQALEVLFTLLPPGRWQRYQKLISKVAAITIGAAWTAFTWGHRATGLPPQADEVVLAGLITAASAELANACIKNLVYAKEARKANAAAGLSSAGSISLESIGRK